MFVVFALITSHALLGAVDNLWHHEITERLPAKRAATGELVLHSVRELIYAFVFLSLAWFRWQGAWAVLALLVPVLGTWWSLRSAVVPLFYGPISWVFTVFGVGVLAWSLRNARAVVKLRRPPEWSRNPIRVGLKAAPRTVLVSGATGFIGGYLVRRLLERGDQVIVLTRAADHALDRFGPHVRIITNLNHLGEGTRIDAVVNLAGEALLGLPWTRGRRAKILGSRIETTRALVGLMARLTRPARVLVSASAIGYYGVRQDEWLDENSAPRSDFQSVLCQEWEAAAVAAEGLGARVVRLRIGFVLGRDGGALPQLLLPIRLYIGAILGKGTQWVSWIHIGDLIRLFELALDTPAVRGPLNAVAPMAVTQTQFQQGLAAALHRPLWLRVPAFVLRALMGEMSQLLVDGQHVVPRRAIEAGFTFRFRQLSGALADLLQQRHAASGSYRVVSR